MSWTPTWAEGGEAMLRAESVVTGYGKRPVLGGVSLDVGPGEIVAVIGPNGAGKSSLLKVIYRLLPLWQGTIIWKGQALDSHRTEELARLGLSYVPQRDRVFPNLTVRENLGMGVIALRDPAERRTGLEQALELFPSLRPRFAQQAGGLSSGEQQMLAIATGLASRPQLVLLDEPSLGLAPEVVAGFFGRLAGYCVETGVSFLIVEQKVREVLGISHRAYVLKAGLVASSGPARSIAQEGDLRKHFLVTPPDRGTEPPPAGALEEPHSPGDPPAPTR